MIRFRHTGRVSYMQISYNIIKKGHDMQTTHNAAEWIEMTILSNMIVNPEHCREALCSLRGSDFQNEAHRVIFSALQNMEQQGNVIRFFVLLDYLQKHNLLMQAGGNDYLKLVYLYSPECELGSLMRLLKQRPN